jgi:hypothetical protein
MEMSEFGLAAPPSRLGFDAVVTKDRPHPPVELVTIAAGWSYHCPCRPCPPRDHSNGLLTHDPEAPLRGALGAYLGHGGGDSKGQQRFPAGSCALALTSGEGWEQRRSPGHTVHGMQEVTPPMERLSFDEYRSAGE